MAELINLDALGEIVVNLTNKLADGIGWIVNKETPKKLAENTYIQEIQKSDYDPITKAALISNAKKIIKEYCNQKSIVEMAIQSLQIKAEPEKIDEDWLEQFMDKARLVSSQEFQVIWGNILARECNVPGSIPLTLLHTLEKMDKQDAEAFTALCRLSVQFDGTYTPIIIRNKIIEYGQFGITFDCLVNLRALGLIEMDFGPTFPGYVLTTDDQSAKVLYHGKEYKPSDENRLKVGVVIFTKTGDALCESINVDEVEGFWETYCLPFWEEKNTEENDDTLAAENQ